MAQLTMIQAITNALDNALEKDENTLIFGQDVGLNGGVFRTTQGLQAKYGEERVFDTPLAESGIGGLAVGLAFENFRPIPEIQFFGFVFETMDAIVDQMARTRYLVRCQLPFAPLLVAAFMPQNLIRIVLKV